MRPRLFPAALLVTLPLLLVMACAGPAPAASPAVAAAPGNALAAYCAANAELAVETRALASQQAISAAEYAATADAFEQLGAIAPAEVTADLATIARSYRAIGEGRSDMQRVGQDVAAATLRLVDVNTRLCPPTGG